jgi:hypothetical protein
VSDIKNSPDERIIALFKYAQSAFRRIGINVAFPQHTDPRKTYKWRYMAKFIEKLDEFHINDQIAYRLIDAVALYASKHKQQHKGLSLLASDQILKVCCDSLAESDNHEAKIIMRLQSDKQLVCNANPLSRQASSSLPNIVKWYMQGLLSCTYMALSERCHSAMTSLNKVERSMLPSGLDLIKARAEILKDARLKYKVKVVFGNDWRSVFG